MLRRTEESKFTSWYFEIDRKLLVMVFIFTLIGAVYAVSAGSVSAARIHKPWYFFINKAWPFYLIGLTTLLGFSMTNKKRALQASIVDIAICLVLLAITLVAPHIIKGSARFVPLGGINVMPSDLMKPGFIILTAWFLAKMHEKYGADIFLNKEAWRLRWLSWLPYLAVFFPVLAIILTHPDLGTTVLYLAVFVMMLLMAGLPLWIFLGFIGCGAVLGMFAFMTMPHVHNRIISFITGTGDTYQVTKSVESIQHGGLLPRGDDAFIKQDLPDAHTDFIYAAISEDLGALVACGLLGLMLYMLKRLVTDALDARDPFVFYATGGAAALFGTQICINLATTLNLIPPKGMTLPFISYGGSSFVSFCFLFGMILAILREDKWK